MYAPDLRDLNLAARISRIEDALKHIDGLLVASSYSGLAAVVLARRTQLRIHRLVLLAPAMHVYEPPVDDPGRLVLPENVQTVIIHGTLDENVPVDFSRRLAPRSCPHLPRSKPGARSANSPAASTAWMRRPFACSRWSTAT